VTHNTLIDAHGRSLLRAASDDAATLHTGRALLRDMKELDGVQPTAR
jgi:hypothetical protein